MATAPPLLVTGRVLDARGRPVGGARLTWADAPVALPDIAALSQPDGRFVLAVPVAGAYRLACDDDRHGSAQAALQVGAAGAAVTLQLPR